MAWRPGTLTVNRAVAPLIRRPSGPVTVTVSVILRGSRDALKRYAEPVSEAASFPSPCAR